MAQKKTRRKAPKATKPRAKAHRRTTQPAIPKDVSRKPLSVKELQADIPKLVAALNHQTPLACVLIATSFIEQCLSTLIHCFTIKGGSSDELCDYATGTLQGMRQRARIAYCCGLFDSGLFNTLIAIGEIRNRFAHSHLELDFSDEIVIAHSNSLLMDAPHSFTSNVPGRTAQDTFADVGATAQGRFVLVSLVAAGKLLGIAHSVKRCKRPKSTWTISAPPIQAPVL